MDKHQKIQTALLIPLIIIVFVSLFGYEEFPEDNLFLRYSMMTLFALLGIAYFYESLIEPLIKDPVNTLIKNWWIFPFTLALIYLFFFYEY